MLFRRLVPSLYGAVTGPSQFATMRTVGGLLGRAAARASAPRLTSSARVRKNHRSDMHVSIPVASLT